LLQHAVSDVPELMYIKQDWDQDMAQGNTPGDFDDYMRLLLLACYTYNKNISLEEHQNRNVYKDAISGDD
jgi:hypothetical protein